MEKSAIISVRSFSDLNKDEVIEVVTPGKFHLGESEFKAVYEESEISGMDGTTTTLVIKDDALILEREGSTTTRMEFKKGEEGVHLYEREGLYKVHPVEYKKGEPKENNADRLQLVAQAICLEEMMCTKIKEGDLYYGKTKRREHVEITDSLRQEVENICLQMHQYFDRQYTPNIKRTKSCNACSLKNICLPQLAKKKSVHNYILKTIKDGEL